MEYKLCLIVTLCFTDNSKLNNLRLYIPLESVQLLKALDFVKIAETPFLQLFTFLAIHSCNVVIVFNLGVANEQLGNEWITRDNTDFVATFCLIIHADKALVAIGRDGLFVKKIKSQKIDLVL